MKSKQAIQVRINTINYAIVCAYKSSEVAHAAYAKVKEACAATEAYEMVAQNDIEMQPYWKAESDAFKSADEAAEAARKAGMEVAAFAMHPCLGRDAAAAAVRAFQTAAEWK